MESPSIENIYNLDKTLFVVMQSLTMNCSFRPQVTTRTCNEIEANFRTLTRNMLTLGLQNKEVKDFFVHVTEKICEPLRAMQVLYVVDSNKRARSSQQLMDIFRL